MTTKRRYALGKRAVQVDRTRRRIIDATLELHRTVGPAATRVSEIAARADVERVTVYSHFPDDAALFSACSAHWRAQHPAPDPAMWAAETDPLARAHLAVRALYGWYRETEPMTANVLRDAALLPALRPIIDRGLGYYLTTLRRSLVAAFDADERRRRVLAAAIAAATEFHTWRALKPLGDMRAAELALQLLVAARAAPEGPPPA